MFRAIFSCINISLKYQDLNGRSLKFVLLCQPVHEISPDTERKLAGIREKFCEVIATIDHSTEYLVQKTW